MQKSAEYEADMIAARVMMSFERLILAMHRARREVAMGKPLCDVDASGFCLYLAKREMDEQEAPEIEMGKEKNNREDETKVIKKEEQKTKPTKTEIDADYADAIVFAIDYQDFIDLLEKEARSSGRSLKMASRIEVTMPEAEFEGDLVSGGFEKFKGITVEIQNDFLERLIELVCFAFESLGFAVSIIPDEDVVISVKVERN